MAIFSRVLVASAILSVVPFAVACSPSSTDSLEDSPEPEVTAAEPLRQAWIKYAELEGCRISPGLNAYTQEVIDRLLEDDDDMASLFDSADDDTAYLGGFNFTRFDRSTIDVEIAEQLAEAELYVADREAELEEDLAQGEELSELQDMSESDCALVAAQDDDYVYLVQAEAEIDV
ncbi:hypothetical protein [Corynebacterium alimapuense]|uniref:Uncharacterized protein n=1 Tax=Corynebacterium alimapuense TaxID=1576874 RepID=A0A3M8K5Q7_9CORY|nr:hypothetical protein [Corynebacterium alimapuense]RNE48541.1 hypothetical protein C5L39_08590 [Corynebacterium alimapuense]